MFFVGCFVFSLVLMLGIHRVVYMHGIGTEMGHPADSSQLIIVTTHRPTGRGHGGFDAQGLGIETGPGVLGTVGITVDLLVMQVDRIREVRSQRQVFLTRGAFEALAMEDHFVDRTDLLHLIDSVRASLAPRVVRSEEIFETLWHVGFVVPDLNCRRHRGHCMSNYQRLFLCLSTNSQVNPGEFTRTKL
jgi:hypothetical protein